MQHLFSEPGQAALAAVMHAEPLMAFDFDGTLAPIVARPDDAQIPSPVADHLRIVAAMLPVAVITGRAVEDVRSRLGFKPSYIIGNHGGEDEADPQGSHARTVALDPVRQQLLEHRGALQECGVGLEDKRQSIALHYRLSPMRKQARALIEAILAPYASRLHIFPGKMVVNVTGLHAPDKGDAMRKLVARSGVRSAFFAGDDINDEPVFDAALPSWITVRVGHATSPSRARYYIDSHDEVLLMLDRILALLRRVSPG
jgi:trehalose 6-phosphate phosphatase